MQYRVLLFIFCMAKLWAQAIPPPYFTANIRHVANNLNTLNAQGQLNPGLSGIIAALTGLTSSQINHALDQMHPAPYSTLVEMQAGIGGQILSLFHRDPVTHFICINDMRVWFDPIGNWLREGNLGEQTAFAATTKGFAAGIEKPLGDYFSIGGGLVWNHSHLYFHEDHGKGSINRYLAALYSDFNMACFYCGLSIYGGIDCNDITRSILLPSLSTSAHGSFNSLDFAGQFSAAYLFGFPYCYLYPYVNFDYLFFRGQSFTETGASSLNLQVHSHLSRTIRSEAGIGFQVQDTNIGETISVVPTVAFGWVMECPIGRSPYTAQFSGEPLTFEAKGWNHTWQLLSADFGLAIYIYNFVISGEYITDMSPSTLDDFWDQRANLSLEYFW